MSGNLKLFAPKITFLSRQGLQCRRKGEHQERSRRLQRAVAAPVWGPRQNLERMSLEQSISRIISSLKPVFRD